VTIDVIPFYLFGAIAVGASLLVIAQRNPIYSVLLLIASFGALSGLYVLLDAPFVAVIQIIVYAGAIMVLFLFVVMLLNAPHEETEEDLAREAGPHARSASSGLKVFGVVLAAFFVVELVWALTRQGGESGAFAPASVTSVAAIGRSLFTDYAFAFEVTSVLILVAMVGAVVLAHREPAGGKAHWGEGAPRSGPPE
jgi:NADH-quinone oxidoreductase subunit J